MRDLMRHSLSRRTFIIGTGAVVIAACSGGDDPATTDPTTADDPAATDPAATDAPAAEPTEAQTEASEATEPTEATEPSETTEASEVAEAPDESSDDGVVALTAAMFDGLAVCATLRSATEGPFPNLEDLDRSDITEGYPGHPLRLGIRVVDAACNPLPGARVEIWHADATGDYSSYQDNGTGKDEGAGTTFLRGFQTADADGIVEFQTIYPGWYRGRAVHIHATVEVDGDDVLTTQFYFDEDYTDAVMATGAYAEFGPPDTRWADDRIVGDPSTDGSGIAMVPALTSRGEGTLGLLNVGVSV